LQLDKTPQDQLNVYAVPATVVSQSYTRATYEINSRQSGLSYRITVGRFEWLLPAAKKWEWMVWTATEVQITHCK